MNWLKQKVDHYLHMLSIIKSQVAITFNMRIHSKIKEKIKISFLLVLN